MGHVPDHTPASAAAEHAALVVALDAGDLAGLARDGAATLTVTCPGCASLLADLAILRAATAALPAAPRTRDYRLTDADAARLRPSIWGRLVGWLAAPRSTVRPLSGALAALGIAGLLLGTTPGLFGQPASTFTTTAAPVSAPGGAGTASDGAEGNARLSAAPSPLARPAAAATIEPATASTPGTLAAPGALSLPGTTSTPGVPDATPPPAALPAPSPAAAAVLAPTPVVSAGVLFGPAAGATPESGLRNEVGATDSASKALPPVVSQGDRNATLGAGSETAPVAPDRTVQLVISLALLMAGIGLFVTNRLLRRRAGA